MAGMYFTEEHQLFRESLKEFLKKEVVPNIDKWEESGTIDRSIWKKFGDMGYFGLASPEEYGGLDLDLFYTIIFLEELQKINSGGFAAAMWAHAYLAMTHVNKEGDNAIKDNYLTASIAGEKIGCLCVSEPFGGSDVAGMRTTAEKKGDTYILNGSKTFITNGVYADYMVVAAKTSPELGNKGISIFMVDKETAGVSASKLNKLGWRASDTAEIAFDNVTIPASNLMGEEGKGFSYIMQHFALERLIMGVNAHARAEFALDYARQYMSERTTFGKTIDKYQALRHTYSDLYADMEICREYNYSVAYRLNKGEYVVKEATISKLKSTKMADEVIYGCLQFLGGYGYMEDYPMARMLRDSRLGPIGGGTSEILREIIAKMVIDKKEYKPATK
ncbi:MAG: acyl-CoA dehydrogenase family protein [Cellulophaga sp.]|uniref:acyl-CoA dehydrogenase family protein n=1 Tax=unclassified Cellulophaga TaxID=2634405 RepID=UPI000C2C0750|nr:MULTISPECIES: acyl-CoA dehydrogenase family protein [unclassified Cellulophaga]MDO6492746.1 acyl-CoA dehydrogenase family protein [Cellulophaga sp. 2_MG-2023]MDO6496294.1 acyl-CoA dehydrogenase family protein [Cellulophaga sp. 3_MG-2023]PKB43438.1 alkylation response protein AidB-like acyl-CoA dehydrogenase [Cellulophaga sp. RHA19]